MNHYKMKLSIITITYNNAEGLRRTIQSVQAQTFRDFEHIIVDGGSTDGSVEIIRQYADSEAIRLEGYKAIRQEKNGKADDTLPNRLLDSLYGNEIIVDGNGQRIGIARGVENPSFVDLYNSCMKHQASFIRRSLFDKYGMYDADMRICSDFDWFFRVIAFHDEVTLQYKDVNIAYFENTGLSYHSPELCAKERQQILDRYMTKRMQRDYLLLVKYPRLSRVGENKIVKLLLRIANRLLK